jgi:hypothetical protein
VVSEQMEVVECRRVRKSLVDVGAVDPIGVAIVVAVVGIAFVGEAAEEEPHPMAVDETADDGTGLGC